jgi:uncharacterized protein YqhQ
MSELNYGGQAVMEGVMMLGPEGKTIACRKADGEIVYKTSKKKPLRMRYKAFNVPVIRGFVSFCASLVDGIQDITWSAAQAGESEEEQLSLKDMIIAIFMALILAVLVFVAVPVFFTTFLYQNDYIGNFGRSLVEGVLRVGLFLGYVIIISRMQDIQRLFAYHGAEHKTINCYEAGEALTLENIRKHSRIHTRCGTSFILMVLILMIIIFTFVGQTTALLRIAIKLALMPIVAGLAFELFRLPLRFPNNIFVRILVAPGLWMQKLTTREPDDGQIKVARAALRTVPGFEDKEPLPDGEDDAWENPDKTLVIDNIPTEDTVVVENDKKTKRAKSSRQKIKSQDGAEQDAITALEETVVVEIPAKTKKTKKTDELPVEKQEAKKADEPPVEKKQTPKADEPSIEKQETEKTNKPSAEKKENKKPAPKKTAKNTTAKDRVAKDKPAKTEEPAKTKEKAEETTKSDKPSSADPD